MHGLDLFNAQSMPQKCSFFAKYITLLDIFDQEMAPASICVCLQLECCKESSSLLDYALRFSMKQSRAFQLLVPQASRSNASQYTCWDALNAAHSSPTMLNFTVDTKTYSEFK